MSQTPLKTRIILIWHFKNTKGQNEYLFLFFFVQAAFEGILSNVITTIGSPGGLVYFAPGGGPPEFLEGSLPK